MLVHATRNTALPRRRRLVAPHARGSPGAAARVAIGTHSSRTTIATSADDHAGAHERDAACPAAPRASSARNCSAEQQEDRRVEHEHDQVPHRRGSAGATAAPPRWRSAAAGTGRRRRTRARPTRAAISAASHATYGAASVSSVSAIASCDQRRIARAPATPRAMPISTPTPASRKNRTTDSPQLNVARHRRRDGRAVEDQRRRVVHEALALEDHDHAARHRQPRDDGRRGHGVRRRDDRAERDGDRPRHAREQHARGDRHRRRRREHEPDRQQRRSAAGWR